MPFDSDTRLMGLPAPAKINRFLHVVGRRADGYHLLQSVFELVSLADTISVRALPGGEIRRLGDMAGAADDLCVRAAKLLKEKTGTDQGAEITVKKRIPCGAGLGGGSSDAATTLIALNRLWGLGLHRSELAALSVSLGADVPFFIGGRNAFVEGIGEKMTPLEMPPQWFALVWPGTGSNTAEAFKAPDLTRDSRSLKIADLSDWLQGRLPKDIGRNDLEPVVAGRIPPVAAALARMSRFGDARMTGSGSAVFVPVPDEASARRAVSGLEGNWLGFVVKSLPSHPLSDWLDNI